MSATPFAYRPDRDSLPQREGLRRCHRHGAGFDANDELPRHAAESLDDDVVGRAGAHAGRTLEGGLRAVVGEIEQTNAGRVDHLKGWVETSGERQHLIFDVGRAGDFKLEHDLVLGRCDTPGFVFAQTERNGPGLRAHGDDANQGCRKSN